MNGDETADETVFPEYQKLTKSLEQREVDVCVVVDARVAISGIPPELVARFIHVLRNNRIPLHEAKAGGRIYKLWEDGDELAFRRLADVTW